MSGDRDHTSTHKFLLLLRTGQWPRCAAGTAREPQQPTDTKKCECYSLGESPSSPPTLRSVCVTAWRCGGGRGACTPGVPGLSGQDKAYRARAGYNVQARAQIFCNHLHILKPGYLRSSSRGTLLPEALRASDHFSSREDDRQERSSKACAKTTPKRKWVQSAVP